MSNARFGTTRRALILLVLFAIPAALAGGQEAFTIVVLPDTQHYSDSPERAKIFEAQTQWIVENRKTLNIVLVSHVGDMVQTNTNPVEWTRANAAMKTLHGQVPYAVCMGNHDSRGAEGTASFVQHFGPQRYADFPWYGGASEDGCDHYQLIEAGPYKLLHLSMRFRPSPAQLQWAQGVLRAHSDRQAILTTHAYLEVASQQGRGVRETLWKGLVRGNPQFFLVLSGHYHGENRAVSENQAGAKVIELLSNYQDSPDGGEGYLRMLRFDPQAGRISVQTYSPWLDRYQTGPDSQFVFDATFDRQIVVQGERPAPATAPAATQPAAAGS